MSSDAPTPLSYANRASGMDKMQTMPNKPKKTQNGATSDNTSSPTSAASNNPASSPLSPPKKAAAAPKPAAAKPAKPSPSSPSPSSSSPSSSISNINPVTGAAIKTVKAPKTGNAMVKAVLSGDTLLVRGNVLDNGQTAPEKTISISGIQAPKFARGRNQTDEPFAWESREYLRKRVIGQMIAFNISYTHEGSGRDYATVTLNGENLAVDIVQHGWATVKTSTGKDGKERSVDSELSAAQEEAESVGRGLHIKNANPAHHIRTIDYTPDPRSLLDKAKSTPIPAVVDQVRDGSTVRVELLHGDEPMKHVSIFLYLAGVQCPRTPLPLNVLQQQYDSKVAEDPKKASSIAKPEEKEPEPWAKEAQIFTEDRLLNRDVNVILQGVDKFGNFFGTLQFPKGNITLKLLELGYGKLVPWSAALTNESDRYKAAEANAKNQRLRVWSDGDSSTASPSNGSSTHRNLTDFQGKVIQVNSGDSIVVADSDGVEHKVSLASLRTPRLKRYGDNKGTDEPYAAESKEFMRSKLVGHKVKVVVEYVRPPPADSNDQNPRPFVTLFQGKQNMNEALVSAGLAETLKHRVNEERSQFYDLYLQAEQKAEEGQRGKFSKKQAGASKIVDLTDKPRPDRRKAKKADDDTESEETPKLDAAGEEKANKAKALTAKSKTFLSFFTRDKQVSGVVEYVFTGSRYKIFVPKESVLIPFALSGIKTPAAPPKSTDSESKGDGLFDQALAFARSRILQHTVRLEVEALDKGDNFLGALFVGKNNLAVDLLREGLAEVQKFSAQRSPYSQDLFAAENEAKTAKKGVWLNYVPGEEKTNGDVDNLSSTMSSTSISDENKEYVTVRVTEIEDANDFYVHFVGERGVEVVESSLRDFGSKVSSDPYVPPKNSSASVAAGQFSDGNWYRVRIEGVTSTGDYRVFFIDYGNHDTLAADKLRQLPSDLVKLPALAHHATLAALTAPKNEDYRDQAAQAFTDAVWDSELLAKVELIDFNKIMHLTLMHASSPISINKQLLRDGWARVSSKPTGKLRELVSELKEHEAFAKQNHYSIWEYGDISDDEDDKPAVQTRRK